MIFRKLCVALAAILALSGALAMAPGAQAAPVAPLQAPLTLESLFVEANCGQVRAFCRGRFYGGPDYRRCVRARGCPVQASPAVNFCRQVRQECAWRWGGGPYFHRCVRARGC